MPANVKISTVATGLEKVSFHSNPKEGQCQRVLKLLHNCTHLTCQQSNAQNSSIQASTVHEPRTSRCSSWIQKRLRDQRSNCQHPSDHRKKQENSRKTSTSASLITLKPLTVWITTKCGKLFKRQEYQTTLPVRNLYAGQEATVRTRHGTKDWLQLGKEYVKVVHCHPVYLTYMQSTS